MNIKITKKQAEEVRKLHANGVRAEVIAEIYHITPRRVWQLAQQDERQRSEVQHKKPNKSSITEVVVRAC